MATKKIVVDDPDGETKRKLRDLGTELDRPYAWVLRRLVDNAWAKAFLVSDTDKVVEIRPGGFDDFGLR